MSEEILRVMLSELGTVRVVCKSCQAVTEIAADRLPAIFDAKRCPCCHTDFDISNRNGFKELAAALALLASMESRVGIEFVIPQPHKPV